MSDNKKHAQQDAQKNSQEPENIILEAESVQTKKDSTDSTESTNSSEKSQKSQKFEFKQLHKILRDIFVGKAPELPKETVNMIVKYLPYIQLIPVGLAVISIFGLMNIINNFNIISNPFILAAKLGLLVLTIAFGVMSYSPLQKLKYRGWEYFYWGVWVNLALSFLTFDVLSILIGGGVGFYVAMQIESNYKKTS